MGGGFSPEAKKQHASDTTISSVLGLLIIAAFAIVPLTLTFLHNSESNSIVIDVSGLQRMLLQRYMKELLLASEGIQVRHDQTRAALKERLRALINGGEVAYYVGSSATVQLPAAPTEEIRQILLEQQRRLEAFTTMADEFLRTPPKASGYDQLRDSLLRENAALLEVANDAVILFAERSGTVIRSIMQWEIVVLLLIVPGALIQTARFLQSEKGLKIAQTLAMEALRESGAVKSSLLSSVSHELRTPLTAIKAMVFNLRDNSALLTATSQKELLANIDDQVDYLNQLVGNLLDMSRLEAGTLKPQREWHVFDELVEGAIRRVDMLLGKRSLRVTLAPALLPIYVDGVQIQQVLINLLDNAIKFSSAESPIEITADSVGETLDVRVSNTGDGIPAAELDRIFDRFYRVQSGRSPVLQGAGLGLAICKGIVEAHGGQILAQSVPGQQTTIVFRLPVPTAQLSGAPLSEPNVMQRTT